MFPASREGLAEAATGGIPPGGRFVQSKGNPMRWLPIVGSVCLGVALGGQTSYISFGVVDNMIVPAILGTSFMDIATKNITTQEQHVELLNCTKVPIRRDGACKGLPVASVSAVCACPQVGTAKLRPAQETWVQPGTTAHIPVKSTYTGNGFVTGRTPLYHNHGVQVAQGRAIMVAGEPLTVQPMGVIQPSTGE